MLFARAGSCVVASLLVIPTLAGQTTRYTLTDLGPGEAKGVNNSGVVVGTRDGQAVMWGPNPPLVLWGLVGGSSAAMHINDAGQIVGTRQDENRCIPVPCFPTLAIWENGALVDIEARFGMPAPIAYGADINNAGGVATESYLFDLPTNSFREYVNMPDMGFIGTSINNDGLVGGRWYGISFEIQRAAIWTPQEGGTITVLLLKDDQTSNVADISDNGIAVGLSFNSNQLARPFSWSDGIAVDLEARCIDNYANPLAVNAVGTIVGDSCSNALVWHGSRAFDLGSLVAGHTDLILLQASDVSNTGFIVGTAATLEGEQRAVLLTPVACQADWDGSGAVGSQDFFEFLRDFFDGNADFDGSGETDSADFFAYLSAFFTGC